MNAFRYEGEEKNLGRHGLVQSGQILYLTDKEAESAKENPSLKKVRGKNAKAAAEKISKDVILKMKELEIDQLDENQLKALADENQIRYGESDRLDVIRATLKQALRFESRDDKSSEDAPEAIEASEGDKVTQEDLEASESDPEAVSEQDSE